MCIRDSPRAGGDRSDTDRRGTRARPGGSRWERPCKLRPMMTYRSLGRSGVQVSRLCFGTGRVDIHFLHQIDRLLPIDEQMRALEDMVRSGKVLYPAVSNWAAWQT